MLFIDRLPFMRRGYAAGAAIQQWVIPLPVVATEPSPVPRAPNRPSRFFPWLLDTAFSGQAHVWQEDLPAIGLRRDRPLTEAAQWTVSAFGERTVNGRYPANLWLFSNVTGEALFLPLHGGLEVFAAGPHARRSVQDRLPLLGIQLFVLTGLRTDIDFRRRTISVWVPAPWWRSGLNLPRRLLPSRPIPWYQS